MVICPKKSSLNVWSRRIAMSSDSDIEINARFLDLYSRTYNEAVFPGEKLRKENQKIRAELIQLLRRLGEEKRFSEEKYLAAGIIDHVSPETLKKESEDEESTNFLVASYFLKRKY